MYPITTESIKTKKRFKNCSSLATPKIKKNKAANKT
jgi:hypothetical protein